MGSPDPGHMVTHGKCVYTPTGGVLPQGADAVVMVENTEEAGDTVLVPGARSPRARTCSPGRRLPAGRDRPFSRAPAHPAGCRRPCSLRLCIRAGITEAGWSGSSDRERARAVLSRPGAGQVRDANASMLAAYLQQYGCIPRIYGIVRDEQESFEAAIARALPGMRRAPPLRGEFQG